MNDMLIDYGPLGLVVLIAAGALIYPLIFVAPMRASTPPEEPKPPALPDPAVIRKLREDARNAGMAAEDQVYRG